MIVLRSQVECPVCHDVIASFHRHDFHYCSCGGTAIDGGLDYVRLVGDAICGRFEELDRSLRIPIEPNSVPKQYLQELLYVLRALHAVAPPYVKSISPNAEGRFPWREVASFARAAEIQRRCAQQSDGHFNPTMPALLGLLEELERYGFVKAIWNSDRLESQKQGVIMKGRRKGWSCLVRLDERDPFKV